MAIKAKLTIIFAALMATLVFGTECSWAADIKGSHDHPLIGRFAGSVIIGYSYKKFDEYLLPEGKVVRRKDGREVYEKSRTIEGKVTRILYVAPKTASVVEVFRNYMRALKKKGFKVLYTCKSTPEYACGAAMTGQPNFQPMLAPQAYDFPDQEVGKSRYASLKKSDPKGDVYVSLLVYNYIFSLNPDRYQHPMVQLDVIEAEPLDDSQIKVLGAKELSSAIAEEGHVALHGIYFDTDSAVLKPESRPALEEIAKLMRQEHDLKLFVVGHTDNTGTFAHNMELSRKRAESVMRALIDDYGVAADRLSAYGVGPLAPVASNATEEGRAMNRRVELVRQ